MSEIIRTATTVEQAHQWFLDYLGTLECQRSDGKKREFSSYWDAKAFFEKSEPKPQVEPPPNEEEKPFTAFETEILIEIRQLNLSIRELAGVIHNR